MTEPKRPYIIQCPINRVTIGIQFDEHNRVYVAIALCNKVDQYIRKMGFIKVTGMLTNLKRCLVGSYHGADWKDTILPRIKAVIQRRADLITDMRTRYAFKRSLEVLESGDGRREFRQDLIDAIRFAPNVGPAIPTIEEMREMKEVATALNPSHPFDVGTVEPGVS